jgi:hypothetical protein
LERSEHVGFDVFGTVLDLYFGGDMEASIALGGQVMGRIDEVRPVAEIIHDTVRELVATAGALAGVVAGGRIPSVGFAPSGDERPCAAREVSRR